MEAQGGPLSLVIAGANQPDVTLLAQTLDALIVARPKPSDQATQHLCLDKGYDNFTGACAALERDYVPHIRPIGEEKKDALGRKKHPARRWEVERTLACLRRCRAILIL